MSTPLSKLLVLAAGALLAACHSDPNHVGLTNPHQPGPAAGRAAGAAVGAVGGNVAGAVVGFGEGVSAGAAKSFDNTRRVVRVWRDETTPDGRVIKVPVDIEVDRYGRPLGSAPLPPSVPAATPK